VQNILTNLHSSHYSHRTKVDTEEGVYELDCSGLGCLLLKKAAPVSLKQLPIEKGYRRARAVSFYSAFTNATELPNAPWQRIPRLADAQPGDFIAWRKWTIPPHKTTGHVMVVMSKPLQEADGSLRVTVFDSTSSPHAQDSRTNSTGIGTGTVWFLVNQFGQPTAFRSSDKDKGFHRYPIAVGRAWIGGR
jgi:hypothetical protein